MSVVNSFQTYRRVGFLKLTFLSAESAPDDEDNGSFGNAECLVVRGSAVEFIHHKALKAY